jgi:hypothetical protein
MAWSEQQKTPLGRASFPGCAMRRINTAIFGAIPMAGALHTIIWLGVSVST